MQNFHEVMLKHVVFLRKITVQKNSTEIIYLMNWALYFWRLSVSFRCCSITWENMEESSGGLQKNEQIELN